MSTNKIDKIKKAPLIKKIDIIILVIIVLVTLVLVGFSYKKSGDESVVISGPNNYYKEYPLSRNIEVEVESVKVVIKNGKVRVEKSHCKNQICVKTGEISYSGQMIICSPNGVVVYITSKKGPDVVVG